MQLKRISIKGFKSFPDKVDLELRSGITAIVGPNGSGKSNISEAVRWVFGEQASRLRGNEATDVIFHGAENRRSEGMAEVLLTFDNADHALPVAFGEVEIGRRVYRNGNNEYLLNRDVVRRRDILEVFANTGIGTRSYGFIEQNQISEIIQAKAIDRRKIFEEAAGVSRYLQQAHEASNKLKRTELDLQRVDDIIRELQRQVRSLKIQSGRAERYLEMKAQLRQTELVRVASESDNLIHRGRRIEETRRQIESLRVSLKAQLEAAEKNLNQQDHQIAELQQEIRSTTHLLQSCQGRMKEIDTRLRASQEEETQLRARANAAQRRADDHAFELAEQKNKQELVQQQEVELVQAVEIAHTEVQNTAQMEQQAARSGEQLALQLEELNKKVQDISQQRLSCEHEAKRVTSEQQTIRQRLETLRAEMTKHAEEHSEVAQQLATTREQLGAQHDQLSEVEAQRGELTQQVQQMKSQLRQHQSHAEHLRGELTRLRHRYETLEELARTHEGFMSGVKSLLDQRDSDQDPGRRVTGVLVEYLSAQPGWEDALESALSTQLQCLFVNGSDDAIVVLEALRQADLGRATIAITNQLQQTAQTQNPLSDIPVSLLESGWRRATDLVETKGVPPLLVEHLLGNVLMAPGLAEALTAADQIPVGWVIATATGEIIQAPGLVTGGRTGSTGLLARQRKLTELCQEIQTMEHECVKAHGCLEVAQEQLDQSSAQLDTLNAQRHELLVQREGTNKQVDGMVALLERLEQQSVQHQDDLERLTEREQELAGLHQRTQSQFAEADQLLQEFSAGRDEIRQQYQQWQQEQAQRRTATNAAKERLLGLQKDLERAKGDQAHSAQRIADLERLEASARTERADLETRAVKANEHQTQAKDELRQAIEQVDQLERQMADQQAGLRQIEDSRRAAAEHTKRLQQELERQQVRDQELQLEAREIDVRRQTLLERCQEEYKATWEECRQALAEREEVPALAELTATITELQDKISRLGEVNPLAAEEYQRENERLTFLLTQHEDLEKASAALQKTMRDAKGTAQAQFMEVFVQVREQFQQIFRRLFGGGRADVMLQDTSAPMESGIEIIAQPPGKKPNSISLLSGGEQALTAVSLLMAIYKLRPAPFCLLDEVDGPLDDSNVERFMVLIREYVEQSQFLIITHNKLTMRASDRFFGVSMPAKAGVSRVVSMSLEEAETDTNVVPLRVQDKDPSKTQDSESLAQ